MDKIHIKIQNSDIPVFTIWGDSDKVVYKDFEKRIDSILPKEKSFFFRFWTSSSHGESK